MNERSARGAARRLQIRDRYGPRAGQLEDSEISTIEDIRRRLHKFVRETAAPAGPISRARGVAAQSAIAGHAKMLIDAINEFFPADS